MSCLPIRRLLSWFRTGSSAHPGITRIRPSISKTLHPTFPHSSLPETDSTSPTSPPPRLPDYRCFCSHATSETSFNVDFKCCSTAACCHHGSQNLPPTSYPISFAHTSNIGCRSTHSATITCLLLIYSLRGYVPDA